MIPYKSKEESGLVCLQRLSRVQRFTLARCFIRRYHRRRTQGFDKLILLLALSKDALQTAHLLQSLVINKRRCILGYLELPLLDLLSKLPFRHSMLTNLAFIETALTETQSKASSSREADDSSRRIIVAIASGKGK